MPEWKRRNWGRNNSLNYFSLALELQCRKGVSRKKSIKWDYKSKIAACWISVCVVIPCYGSWWKDVPLSGPGWGPSWWLHSAEWRWQSTLLPHHLAPGTPEEIYECCNVSIIRLKNKYASLRAYKLNYTDNNKNFIWLCNITDFHSLIKFSVSHQKALCVSFINKYFLIVFLFPKSSTVYINIL